MKKNFVAGILAAAMAVTTIGCSGKSKGNTKPTPTPGGDAYVPTQAEQNTPLVFGIDGADGVFSPYFSTASYDGEIAGMTQIGMLTSEGGDYKYGNNYACVAKDVDITYLDSEGKETTSAEKAKNGGYTRYDFLIKKGIKFSDGEDLTIKDVLFNLYLFLDPAYSGSTTIYSTDIVGLNKYRTGQDDKGAMSTIDATAATAANARLLRVYQWLTNKQLLEDAGGNVDNIPEASKKDYTYGLEDYKDEIEADILSFIPEFKTEVKNDYDSAMSSFKETCKEYAFNEVWELYFYNWGKVKRKTYPGSDRYVKVDAQGNEVTEAQLDANDALPDNDPNKKVYRYKLDWDGSTYQEDFKKLTSDDAKKNYAINFVYKTATGFEYDENFTLDYGKIEKTALRTMIYGGSASYSTLYSAMQLDERAKIIKQAEGDGGFKEIAGVKTSKRTEFRNEKTKKTYQLGEEYDVLSITINKIDPKAIWNFSFTVAPLHYYAPGADADGVWNVKNNYGVTFNSTAFMTSVRDKQGVPVGAGAYKASRESGLGNAKYPGKNEFLSNNRVYYERNTYFDTLDEKVGGGPIQNAKIKYFQYKIVNSSVLLQSLQKNEIDVGSPNATPDTIQALAYPEYSHLASKSAWTNGYGYVGINAGKIADVWLRRAIIKAMNTDLVMDYYKQDSNLASIIYRPMSLQSWAYPSFEKTTYSGTSIRGEALDYAYDEAGQDIAKMLKDNGYTVNSAGKVTSGPDGKIPEITFTIAGESDDHPAYVMFKNAQEVLKRIGINVNVKTDAFALKKLASGQLEVWAAAWGSTIDPDMYQVYHKDSTAGSTLNWGYREIKANSGNKYDYELEVITRLSDLIDEGRNSTDNSKGGTRAQTYWSALDLVMELAVEMPTYQRTDLTAYNKNKIKASTLNQKPTAFDGLFSRIWEVGYNN